MTLSQARTVVAQARTARGARAHQAQPFLGSARNPLGLNRARLRARRRAFPSPLRGGVGVGGEASNSDVREAPLQCLVCRHRALRLRPPPRSAFQAESALPARGREGVAAFEALLQSERIMR